MPSPKWLTHPNSGQPTISFTNLEMQIKKVWSRKARKTGLDSSVAKQCSFTAGNENDNSNPIGKEKAAFENGKSMI